ncbi:hypothetical protein LTR66_014022 [Elasticomyces elasticus]|nr:hypothetical protein LTR66_014022 [Elasticomyces elasticus]
MKISLARTFEHSLSTISSRSYVCPSCQLARTPRPIARPAKRVKLEQFNSTSSHTAVNATKAIPARYKPLYAALTDIQRTASAHVNVSRLRLALQGLETENPTVRIAILGLNVQDTARDVAKLLLADALEDAAAWEEQILSFDGANGIIIRHGTPSNSNIPQKTPVPTLLVPSSMLERLNVELLVTSVSAEGVNGTGVPSETFLAPAIGTPTAFDGRQVTINQPVHQALLVVQGFDELVRILELLSATSFRTTLDRNAVSTVVELPGMKVDSAGSVMALDTAAADRGLQALRKGVSHAMIYEHETLASGLPRLQEWLTKSTNRDQSPPRVIEELITSLLTGASSSLVQSTRILAETNATQTLNYHSRAQIGEVIEDFSRAAHKELQAGLASAWSSQNWRKLSWYKLFWRVDDVGLIVNDLVSNAWLPKTERAVYELSGRLLQLGITPVMAEQGSPVVGEVTAFEPTTAQPTILDPATPLLATAAIGPANELSPAPTEAVIETSPVSDKSIVVEQPRPLSLPLTSTISSTRSSYLADQITSLTTTAQQLVLRTLSISGLSAGLSAVTYVGQIAPTVYEAGTIFAVGTVFALFRMQSGWQRATKDLEIGLLEEGKDVVRRVVQRMRELVQDQQEVDTRDPVEIKMLEDARTSVGRAQMALDELKTSPASKSGKQ